MAREDHPGKDRPSQPKKDKTSGNKNLAAWNGQCTLFELKEHTMYGVLPWLYEEYDESVKDVNLQKNCLCGATTHLIAEGGCL